jgi:hypothetical protein
LEQCTQELTTVQDAKSAVEDRLKSCQTAAVETRDYLNAENLLLCNINDELRLDLSSLSEVIEDLKSRLENRSLETSPILHAMLSVNQRSLEEELTMVNASLAEEPSSQVHRASEETSSTLMMQETRAAILPTNSSLCRLQSQVGGTEMRKFQTVCGCCMTK